jgi:hypothetical protein
MKDIHIRTGKVVHGFETETCVFYEDWTLHLNATLAIKAYQDVDKELRFTKTLTASAALFALSFVTSSTVPWISTRSTFWFRSSMTPSRIAWTSASLFLLPVMKFSCFGTDGVDILVDYFAFAFWCVELGV